MRTEKALAGGAVALLVLGLLLAVVLPTGVEGETKPTPGGEVSVAEIDISLGNVTGETVEFEVVPRLSHRGGVSKNLSVVVRATQPGTELLVSEEEAQVGRMEGNGEKEVKIPVVVEREGKYVFKVVVYKGDRRVSTASRRIKNVGAVRPEYAKSGISFFSFPLQPSIEYSIGSVNDDNVELKTASYISNRGNEREEVTLAVEARQSDSMIVADRKEVSVSIPAGSVKRIPATLNVPDGYNYYLDATAWRGENIVATHRNAANLKPNEKIKVNRKGGEAGLKVGDFESGGEQRRESEREELRQEREDTNETAEQEGGAQGQPGFTAVVALLALLVITVARRIQ